METLQSIPPFLYAYYLDGCTARDAHEKLTKLGGAFQLCTLRQVQEHYAKFRSREFMMGGERSSENSTSILECLKHRIVCENLTKHLGLSDILTIRKVCQSFQTATSQFKTTIQKVVILSDWLSYDIFADSFHVKYEKVLGGFVVSKYHGGWSQKSKHVKEERKSLTEIVQRDLSLILGNPNISISELIIPGFEVDTFMVLNSFGKAESKQIRKISVPGLIPLKIILPILAPTFLEEIKVVHYYQKDVLNAVDQTLYSMPQWKQAKVLVSDQMFCYEDLVEDFGHFESVDFVVGEKNRVHTKDLVRLKNLFLQRPSFQKFEIAPHKDHKKDPLFYTIPPSFVGFHVKGDLYHFPYPNSKNQILSIRINKRHVIFRRPAFNEDMVTVAERRQRDDRARCL